MNDASNAGQRVGHSYMSQQVMLPSLKVIQLCSFPFQADVKHVNHGNTLKLFQLLNDGMLY